MSDRPKFGDVFRSGSMTVMYIGGWARENHQQWSNHFILVDEDPSENWTGRVEDLPPEWNEPDRLVSHD